MTFWDRLIGREETHPGRAQGADVRSADEIAVERYRYLLRTAPPETIEQVHSEAFGRLTPEQRSLLFEQLTAVAREGDRPSGAEPAMLARSAIRSELRSPGILERSFGSRGSGGIGVGSVVAGSLFGTIAGVVVGSALAQAFLPDVGSADAVADPGASDADPGDTEGDASGGFGDFGGGDFGGGDFGGGDFGGGDFGF
ncbi:hypothetical protein [Planctomonas psychrotolerans]|uniref:hypothetical protein n=1 Tax=Planctomonas psychrotolerans TaxID=2528712 RepID=UPI00123B92C5|nr:hypothetical protein [Planctomonas psychrotolerans]